MSDAAHSHSFDGSLQGLIQAVQAHGARHDENRVELRTTDGRLFTDVHLDSLDGTTVVATLGDPDRGNEEPLGEVDYSFVPTPQRPANPLQDIIMELIGQGFDDDEDEEAPGTAKLRG
jgi:hypothetical protein